MASTFDNSTKVTKGFMEMYLEHPNVTNCEVVFGGITADGWALYSGVGITGYVIMMAGFIYVAACAENRPTDNMTMTASAFIFSVWPSRKCFANWEPDAARIPIAHRSSCYRSSPPSPL